MSIYWTLFLWPALVSLFRPRLAPSESKASLIWLTVFVALIIGLRYNVGVDWGNYLDNYDTAASSTWIDSMLTNDAAYGLLNWAANEIGQGIWLVNLVCASIFSAGILVLCRLTTRPWLAFTVAIPFLAIVVGMNYTRQSAAMGWIFFGIAALHQNKPVRFALCIIAASSFHRTAAVLFPLGAILYTGNRYWRIFWVGVGSLLAYYSFLQESSSTLVETYLNQQMISDGTVIRVLMNATAAACFLVFGRAYDVTPSIRRFWTLYSLSVIPFVLAIVVLPPLTAIDRVALYWMPLQVYVFGNLPDAMKKRGMGEFMNIGVVTGYGLVQFVWFAYANFSWAWLPYRFYPLVVLTHTESYR